MILPSRTTLTLAGALALSLAANAFLFWQLAQAKPECRAKQAENATKAVEQAREDDGKRNAASADAGKASDARAAEVVTKAATDTQTTKKDIHDAYRQPLPQPVPGAACVRVVPVPDRVQRGIDEAVRRAGAAAGALPEAAGATSDGAAHR